MEEQIRLANGTLRFYRPAPIAQTPHTADPIAFALRLSGSCVWCAELGLSVNVHSRSAGHHAIRLLESTQARGAVLHAFDGRPHYAEDAAKRLGYRFSVAPIVSRSPSLQKMVARLPLDALLLETDAPALVREREGETGWLLINRIEHNLYRYVDM